MFGRYDIVMKAAPGVGVVSSVVLESDDLDEVDFEWLGADDQHVQSNYFGKGNTAVYDRGANLTNPGSQDDFHTYSIDYTADHITWSIDGQVLRTLTPQTADPGQYPQTPMQLKIGSWVSTQPYHIPRAFANRLSQAGGDPSEPAGTIAWAGGPIDYTKGPFTFTVKSIKAIDYSTGTSYSYGDTSGTWQSIKSSGGQINSNGNGGASASTAAASGSTVTAVTTGAISAVPITATTTNTAELSSATGSLVSIPDSTTSFSLSSLLSPPFILHNSSSVSHPNPAHSDTTAHPSTTCTCHPITSSHFITSIFPLPHSSPAASHLSSTHPTASHRSVPPPNTPIQATASGTGGIVPPTPSGSANSTGSGSGSGSASASGSGSGSGSGGNGTLATGSGSGSGGSGPAPTASGIATSMAGAIDVRSAGASLALIGAIVAAMIF